MVAVSTIDQPGVVRLVARVNGAVRQEWIGSADEAFSCPQSVDRAETVAFVSARGRVSELVFGGPDGVVHSGASLKPYTCPSATRDGRHLAWIGTDGALRVADDLDNLSGAKIDTRFSDPQEVALLSNGIVAVRTRDGRLRVAEAFVKGSYQRLHAVSPNENWILASTAKDEFMLKAIRLKDGCSVDLPAAKAAAGMRSLAWEREPTGR